MGDRRFTMLVGMLLGPAAVWCWQTLADTPGADIGTLGQSALVSGALFYIGHILLDVASSWKRGGRGGPDVG